MSTFVDRVKLMVGGVIPKSWLDQGVDNDAALYASVNVLTQGANVNGSFEQDSDLDDIPDGYDLQLLQAGSGTIRKSSSQHGKWAFEFTRALGAGNGGGYLEQSGPIVCAPGFFELELFYLASAAVKSTLEIFWFDEDENTLGSTLVATIEEETAWRRYFFALQAPADVRFAKLRLTGGTTDVDVPGTVAFDGVRFEQVKLEDYSEVLDDSVVDDVSTPFRVWTVIDTRKVFIPEDATTLSVTWDVDPHNAGGGRLDIKIRIDATDGTVTTGLQRDGYSPETSTITIPAAAKGTYADVEFMGYEDTTPATADFKFTSNVVNGREANIVIT